MQLTLRRYAGDDVGQAFSERLPFDAVCRAEIRAGRAWIDGMLVAGRQMSRADRRQIEVLLRQHGAVVLEADRQGRIIQATR